MSDFDQLRKKFPHLTDSINRKEKAYKKAQLFLDIKNHIAIKGLIEELENQVLRHNQRLIDPEPLTEQEREVILTDKERCMWLLNKFPLAEKRIKLIEKEFKKL